MNKTKSKILIGALSVFCVASCLIFANNVETAYGDSGESVWWHFNSTLPTLDADGTREYCVNCATGELFFGIPDSGTVIDKGKPSDALKSTIVSSGDDRLIPRINGGTNTYVYGSYPQTAASSEVNAALANITRVDSNGYKVFQGCRYAELNGSYFKVEPIKWKVLEYSDQSNCLLVCTMVLDCGSYGNSRNYISSNAKTFLQASFFPKAFSKKEALWINYGSHNDAEQFSDRIFLLSKDEYLNSSLGFNTNNTTYDTARRYQPTDYARAKGVSMSHITGANDAIIWTRTGYTQQINSHECAWYIDHGRIEADYANNSSYGYVPAMRFNLARKHAYFGEYPQTRVASDTIVSDLASVTPDSSGYRYYCGDYYLSYNANPYEGAAFDSGLTIVNNLLYVFKVEPIKWRVLSDNGSNLLLLSDKVIDVQKYCNRDDTTAISVTARNNYDGSDMSTSTSNVYANNYKFSDIRKWLNETFINKAGISAKDILTSSVENGGTTTREPYLNPYTCIGTNDKVYLFSYEEFYNTLYFSKDSDRCCKSTDYAKANHCYYSTDNLYKGNAVYWSRSPEKNDANKVTDISYNGPLYSNFVNIDRNGVRPCFKLMYR